jgi:hypothetical protein
MSQQNMDNSLSFFISLNTKQSQADLYESLRDYVQSTTGFAITDRIIRRLETEHNTNINVGKSEIAAGKRLGEAEQIVIVIFEIKDGDLVCTESRGAFVDSPVYVDGDYVTLAIEFSRLN